MTYLAHKMGVARNKWLDKLEARSYVNEKTTLEALYKIFLQNIKKMDQIKLTLKVKKKMGVDNELDELLDDFKVWGNHTITIKKKDIEKHSLDTSYTDWNGMTLYDYCKSVLRKYENVNETFGYRYVIKELEIVSHQWKWGEYKCRIQQPDNQLWIDKGK